MMSDRTWLKKVIEPLPSKRMQEAILQMFDADRTRLALAEKVVEAAEVLKDKALILPCEERIKLYNALTAMKED